MKRPYTVFAILCGVFCATNAFAQVVSVTWPLTTNLGGTSTNNSLVTGNTEVVSNGAPPPPPMSVFGYHVPEGQRLWVGTTGWIAGSENPTRYIQFDAVPTSGNQLTVTNVSFNYGGAGINGHIKANVYYSVDAWNSRMPLNTVLLAYPTTMLQFTKAVSVVVPIGQMFSLRIYPYAILNNIPMSPTFASHNSVVIKGTSAPAPGPDLRITKTGVLGANGGITYTLTIQNIGSMPAPGPIVVNDTLVTYPAGTVFTGAGGTGLFSCPAAGTSGPWMCTRAAPLLPGPAVTLLISVKVPKPPGGLVKNCATVTQGNGGPADVNPANNSSCVNITVP